MSCNHLPGNWIETIDRNIRSWNQKSKHDHEHGAWLTAKWSHDESGDQDMRWRRPWHLELNVPKSQRDTNTWSHLNCRMTIGSPDSRRGVVPHFDSHGWCRRQLGLTVFPRSGQEEEVRFRPRLPVGFLLVSPNESIYDSWYERRRWGSSRCWPSGRCPRSCRWGIQMLLRLLMDSWCRVTSSRVSICHHFLLSWSGQTVNWFPLEIRRQTFNNNNNNN